MPVFTKEENITNSYLPPNITTFNQKLSLLFSLFFPVLIFFILRAFLQSDMPQLSGSSLLTRIGISGNDVHNGGLLGALQFLGGNRITICLANYSSDLFSSELDNKIDEILNADEPIVVDINCHEHHTYEPRIFGWKTPIEDMYPYINRKEFKDNVRIKYDYWISLGITPIDEFIELQGSGKSN